jgi:hypothetical protein
MSDSKMEATSTSDRRVAALKTADQFAVAHYVVLTVGIVLAVVVTVSGFIPVCPPSDGYCSDENKYIDFIQLARGAALGLVVWWGGTFGRMLLAHARRTA